MRVGGFPEPFLKGTRSYYNRWKRSHVDLILKEELLTLSAVRDIQSIETLIELLRTRVGSPVSSNSLARDLLKSPNTIQHWLRLLEDLYVIFKLTPYHKNIARALLKEPKYYFYDNELSYQQRKRSEIIITYRHGALPGALLSIPHYPNTCPTDINVRRRYRTIHCSFPLKAGKNF